MFKLNFSKFFFVGLILFITLSISSCIDDIPIIDDNEEPTDIKGIIANSANYSLYNKLLDEIGILYLSGSVFVPTNAAINNYLMDRGTTINDLTSDEISLLIDYQMLFGGFLLEQLPEGITRTTAQYDGFYLDIKINKGATTILNETATVIKDIEAEDGIIHEIDAVLAPPTSYDWAIIQGLDSFVVALNLIDANTGIIDMITQSEPYSLIAPTNEAFQNALSDNGWSSMADIPISVLENAIEYHIFEENIELDGESGAFLTPINGDNSYYDGTSQTIRDSGIYEVAIVDFEIQGSNGTLLTIDEVIKL